MVTQNQNAEVQVPASRLLLFDGHAYAYRAYYAIKRLSSPGGASTNAIYGFIKMAGRARQVLNPTQMAVVWDGGLAEERVSLLPGYKAQRPPMPEDLAIQIDEIAEYLKAAGIASIERDGVEADDLIGALAQRAAGKNASVVIASSDKDFMQLVGPAVGLLNPGDKTERVWTAAEVIEKVGVRPEQVVDWLSLTGDSVDNIPGVPGVGAKTATSLLVRFDSVNGIYARLAEVQSERLRENLRQHESAVRQNQKLVSLKTDLPCDASCEALSIKEADVAALRELYARWGFKSLARELPQITSSQSELFSDT